MDGATRLREQLAGIGLSQRGLARAIGVNERTVRDWVMGDTPVPAYVWRWLDDAIAPPPGDTTPDDDRDEACVAALEPHVRRVVERARTAGWHEGEAYAAALCIIVQAMRDAAGDGPTRQTLESAILQMNE